jgi:hypothetical protein
MKTDERPASSSAAALSAATRSALTPSSVVRLGALAFGFAGACLALGGVSSILIGVPTAAHGVRPISGLGDIGARLGEMAPLLSVGAAALVAAVVVVLLEMGRLRSIASGLELIVLGVVIVACVAGASGRIGYAVDGSVLPAAVMGLTGGLAIAVAGVVAALSAALGGPSAPSAPSAPSPTEDRR